MVDDNAARTPSLQTTARLAGELMRLHQDPSLLTVVNVWDAITTRVVAAVEGTRAIATSSHAIAVCLGYQDGENIPLELHLDMIRRIIAATELPVTADLEGGYGDAPETVRRAIALGVVGANIEDQLKPVAEAARQVEQIMRVAEQEGVDFVLNARTDAYHLGRQRDRETNMRDALERCRAYLDAGAPAVFVPAILDDEEVQRLVAECGPQRLTLIGIPGLPSLARLEELGVARVSYGPISQNVALTALQDMALDVQRGGGAPEFRILN